MKNIVRLLLLSGCALLSANSVAWNGDGHRIVAQIAYDQLSPKSKHLVDELTYQEDQKYQARSRFLYISTWADRIKFQGDKRFDPWHFIDLPLSEGGVKTQAPSDKNAVWAVQECQRVLSNPSSTKEKKALYLKLLVHIVADLHQPLHTVSRFSWRYPHGDYGGNLIEIRDQHKRKVSLHQFWDRGLGLFKAYEKRFPIRAMKTRKVASAIERHFPHVRFGLTRLSGPPMSWANEGRFIAKSFVYSTPAFATPSGYYIAKGQRICEERLALAGYRLAHILNSITLNKDIS